MCHKRGSFAHIKALIPAAGKGTRFYPFTKTVPKELVPIANHPAIDFSLEELAEAGITDLCLVSSAAKQILSGHVKKRVPAAQVVNQALAKGLGDAIFVAREKFCKNTVIPVLLPDNIFVGPGNILSQLINCLKEQKCCAVIAVKAVPEGQTDKYGIIKKLESGFVGKGVFQIDSIVEKPPLGKQPSDLAAVGRYVFSNCIFDEIAKTELGFGQEIQLTDAINHLIKSGKKVIGFEISQKFLDVGSPDGWLEANRILFKHGLGEILNECSSR